MSQLIAYEQVAALFILFEKRRLPIGYATMMVGDLDLVMVDVTAAGYISQYLSRDGGLGAEELSALDVTVEELAIVLQALTDDVDADARDYFRHLFEMVKLILDANPRAPRHEDAGKT